MGKSVSRIIYLLAPEEQRAIIASISQELKGMLDDNNAYELVGTADAVSKTIKKLPGYKSILVLNHHFKKIANASGEEIADVETAFSFIYDKDWTYDRILKWFNKKISETSEKFWRTAAKVAAEFRDEYVDSGQGKVLSEILDYYE